MHKHQCKVCRFKMYNVKNNHGSVFCIVMHEDFICNIFFGMTKYLIMTIIKNIILDLIIFKMKILIYQKI